MNITFILFHIRTTQHEKAEHERQEELEKAKPEPSLSPLLSPGGSTATNPAGSASGRIQFGTPKSSQQFIPGHLLVSRQKNLNGHRSLRLINHFMTEFNRNNIACYNSR